MNCLSAVPLAFKAWKKDPTRLVGFFGYQQTNDNPASFRGSSLSSSDFQPVTSGLSPYSLVSDRAVFVHTQYISSLPLYNDRSSCCQLLLSLQISAVSGKAPALIKANPRELSGANVLNGLVDWGNEDSEPCFGECIPSWLQVDLSDGVTTLR